MHYETDLNLKENNNDDNLNQNKKILNNKEDSFRLINKVGTNNNLINNLNNLNNISVANNISRSKDQSNTNTNKITFLLKKRNRDTTETGSLQDLKQKYNNGNKLKEYKEDTTITDNIKTNYFTPTSYNNFNTFSQAKILDFALNKYIYSPNDISEKEFLSLQSKFKAYYNADLLIDKGKFLIQVSENSVSDEFLNKIYNEGFELVEFQDNLVYEEDKKDSDYRSSDIDAISIDYGDESDSENKAKNNDDDDESDDCDNFNNYDKDDIYGINYYGNNSNTINSYSKKLENIKREMEKELKKDIGNKNKVCKNELSNNSNTKGFNNFKYNKDNGMSIESSDVYGRFNNMNIDDKYEDSDYDDNY